MSIEDMKGAVGDVASQGIRIYLADCENQMLREIAEPSFKRRDIAQSYALSIRAQQENEEVIDWGKVNRAIVARWSFSAMEWIKKQAWSGECFGPRKGGLRG